MNKIVFIGKYLRTISILFLNSFLLCLMIFLFMFAGQSLNEEILLDSFRACTLATS